MIDPRETFSYPLSPGPLITFVLWYHRSLRFLYDFVVIKDHKRCVGFMELFFLRCELITHEVLHLRK
jgi:hypothetical protein